MALLRESERGEVGVHASHLHLQACGNGRSGGFRGEGVTELAGEEGDGAAVTAAATNNRTGRRNARQIWLVKHKNRRWGRGGARGGRRLTCGRRRRDQRQHRRRQREGWPTFPRSREAKQSKEASSPPRLRLGYKPNTTKGGARRGWGRESVGGSAMWVTRGGIGVAAEMWETRGGWRIWSARFLGVRG